MEEKYLNRPIKEVISQYSAVGSLLEEYKIGCVPCRVGSCLLKDVVRIHGLTADQEAELMQRIEGIIYPGKGPAPIIKVNSSSGPPVPVQRIRYSAPLQKLVEEHLMIKEWLALIPVLVKKLSTQPEIEEFLVLDGLDFIRTYADRFHHAKEEEILFPYFDREQEVIKTMLADHQTARGYVKSMLKAVQEKNKLTLVNNLESYAELLEEHIKKEDEILYPWLDRNLTVAQKVQLTLQFSQADNRFNEHIITGCLNFIKALKQRLVKKS